MCELQETGGKFREGDMFSALPPSTRATCADLKKVEGATHGEYSFEWQAAEKVLVAFCGLDSQPQQQIRDFHKGLGQTLAVERLCRSEMATSVLDFSLRLREDLSSAMSARSTSGEETAIACFKPPTCFGSSFSILLQQCRLTCA